MEDIVALKVVFTSGPSHYFLTWGRLIDPVETKGLEELVRSHLPKFGLTGEASKMLEQLKQGREIYYLGAEIETGASRPRT